MGPLMEAMNSQSFTYRSMPIGINYLMITGSLSFLYACSMCPASSVCWWYSKMRGLWRYRPVLHHCIVLHCTTLYYTELHCTTLYYTALYSTGVVEIQAWGIQLTGDLPSGVGHMLCSLHCTVFTALHCTVLHCLHCTALECTDLHCTSLHCTALHFAVLQYNTLHTELQSHGPGVVTGRGLLLCGQLLPNLHHCPLPPYCISHVFSLYFPWTSPLFLLYFPCFFPAFPLYHLKISLVFPFFKPIFSLYFFHISSVFPLQFPFYTPPSLYKRAL